MGLPQSGHWAFSPARLSVASNIIPHSGHLNSTMSVTSDRLCTSLYFNFLYFVLINQEGLNQPGEVAWPGGSLNSPYIILSNYQGVVESVQTCFTSQ